MHLLSLSLSLSSSSNKGAANAGVCGGYLGYKFGVGAECRGEANGLSEVVLRGVSVGREGGMEAGR